MQRRAAWWFGVVACAALAAPACGSSTKTTVTTAAATTATSTGAALAGSTFTDPQGDYMMTIGSDWQDVTGKTPSVGAEIEAWLIGSADDAGFTSSVNVLTEKTGLGLSDYVKLSLSKLAPLTLIEQHQVTGPSGSKLALIEYQGVVDGSKTGTPLHFLAVVASNGDHVALATLTGTEAQFPIIRTTIEPYLLTLQTA